MANAVKESGQISKTSKIHTHKHHGTFSQLQYIMDLTSQLIFCDLSITQLRNCVLSPQMKSLSTFSRSLKGNRGAVCNVTRSTDPHIGLGGEGFELFLFCGDGEGRQKFDQGVVTKYSYGDPIQRENL